MDTPIIISESGAIDVFRSLHEAENYIEPIDVKNNEYVIYDASGRLLAANVVEQKKKRSSIIAGTSEQVVISRTEEVPAHAEDVKRLLSEFLAQSEKNEQSVYDELNLKQLVERSLRYATS